MIVVAEGSPPDPLEIMIVLRLGWSQVGQTLDHLDFTLSFPKGFQEYPHGEQCYLVPCCFRFELDERQHDHRVGPDIDFDPQAPSQ